jgi:hypothetical protein
MGLPMGYPIDILFEYALALALAYGGRGGSV